MYELWTKWPANLVTAFDSAAEGKFIVERAIEKHGATALDNHALMLVDGDDVVGIAENRLIVQELSRLRIAEDASG